MKFQHHLQVNNLFWSSSILLVFLDSVFAFAVHASRKGIPSLGGITDSETKLRHMCRSHLSQRWRGIELRSFRIRSKASPLVFCAVINGNTNHFPCCPQSSRQKPHFKGREQMPWNGNRNVWYSRVKWFPKCKKCQSIEYSNGPNFWKVKEFSLKLPNFSWSEKANHAW